MPEVAVPAAVAGAGGAWGCRVGSEGPGHVWGPWDREISGAAAPLPRRKTPGGCPGRERWQRVLLPFSAEEMSRFSRVGGGGGRGNLCVPLAPPWRPPPSPQHPEHHPSVPQRVKGAAGRGCPGRTEPALCRGTAEPGHPQWPRVAAGTRGRVCSPARHPGRGTGSPGRAPVLAWGTQGLRSRAQLPPHPPREDERGVGAWLGLWGPVRTVMAVDQWWLWLQISAGTEAEPPGSHSPSLAPRWTRGCCGGSAPHRAPSSVGHVPCERGPCPQVPSLCHGHLGPGAGSARAGRSCGSPRLLL